MIMAKVKDTNPIINTWMTPTCICVGQPVGWCIADSETSQVLQAFLSSIKDRSPTVPVKVVMTDDGKRHSQTYTTLIVDLHVCMIVHNL